MNQSKSVSDYGGISESYEDMAKEVERIQAKINKSSSSKNETNSDSSFMEEHFKHFEFSVVEEIPAKSMLSDDSTDDIDENVILEYFEPTRNQQIQEDNQYDDNACSLVPSTFKHLNTEYLQYKTDTSDAIESKDDSENWRVSRNYFYHTSSLDVSKTDTNSPDTSEVQFTVPSLVSRVKYTLARMNQSMPSQTEPLKYHSFESQNDNILSDYELNLPRFPIKCPISICGCVTMPSHFCNHIIFDHPTINFLRFVPKKVINIQINPKGDKINLMTCQSMLLIKNKLTNLGYDEFEDCLPIMLMTMKTKKEDNEKLILKSETALEYQDYHIWLTGIFQFPMQFTLTVWSHDNDKIRPNSLLSLTHMIGCINKQYTFNEIKFYGNVLSFSQQEINNLTYGGKEKLKCQLTIH
ncbi:unnamed protein product [Diamesa hyperborea]